ncbi:hypothetical protein [Moraxella oblonga]|uniref:hypothetical protein n=1 Tax=Moraxella oblonga TaxID=200413 RepID=UPI0012EE724A|nr:hypothetical protein [Moraxella oblonga]
MVSLLNYKLRVNTSSADQLTQKNLLHRQQGLLLYSLKKNHAIKHAHIQPNTPL